MLPNKPKSEDYSDTFLGLYQAQIDYYKAIAERSIEALNSITALEKKHGGDYYEARDIADTALAEIEATTGEQKCPMKS
jgi:hypothetical protein